MVASFSTRCGYHQHSLQIYYCCTHGTRHGHHGCLILVLTSSLSPVNFFFWTCSWSTITVAARYRCVKRRTMHTAINHAHCCSARLFAQRATQPGGRPPAVLAKQTSTIIFSSTSSSLLQTTPTVYCATPVSVIFQAKKQDTTHVIYKFINN